MLPLGDREEALDFLRFGGERANLLELILQPPAIVQRSRDEIEHRAALRVAGVILFDARLEADGWE
jgi:hypothetical protein